MKTLHVGGLNPIRRYKTFDDALKAAQDDDTIELHKKSLLYHKIKKNIIIKGNNNTVTVENGKSGLVCDAPVTICDLNFKINPRANGIKLFAGGRLENVKMETIGPARDIYPTIKLVDGTLTAINSTFQRVNTEAKSRFIAEQCTFTDYYGCVFYITDHSNMSIFNGKVSISDSKIDCCLFRGVTHIYNSHIGVFNLNHGNMQLKNCTIVPTKNEPKVKLKKEPIDGPLKNVNENTKFSIENIDGDLLIDSYISEIPKEFVGIHGLSGSIEIRNTQNEDIDGYHLIQNSTLSFINTNDQAYYDVENTTLSMVRSEVNISQHVETAMDKLNKLIGLSAVKENIKSIMNTITANQNSSNKDFNFSYHMVFAGDPGTGKTTVAKIVAQALFEIGAVPQNKCTEVSIDRLIKGYVGQTAANVREILDDALGGVVFIDEAYELATKDGQNSFNSEALSVLIRYMEEHRDDLVVIAAGYTKEMKDFLASNVGLSRRFQWVEFDDYTPEEMAEIFEMVRNDYSDEYEYKKLSEIIPKLFNKLVTIYLSKPDAKGRITNGGNGGLVRNVYQQILQIRNNRIAENVIETKAITQDDILTGFKNEMAKAVKI